MTDLKKGEFEIIQLQEAELRTAFCWRDGYLNKTTLQQTASPDCVCQQVGLMESSDKSNEDGVVLRIWLNLTILIGSCRKLYLLSNHHADKCFPSQHEEVCFASLGQFPLNDYRIIVGVCWWLAAYDLPPKFMP